MAVNCCVVPLAIDGSAGVTAIDCSVAEVTVTVVDPVTLPLVAVMVAEPGATPVTRPPLETVATEASDVVHPTVVVKSAVEWSE